MTTTATIESLDARRLFSAAIAAVNFQPASAPRAPGMLIDYGSTYGIRRGGLSYGWDTDSTTAAVDRNATKVQRNDTFIAMQQGGVNRTWELGVDDGVYSVYLVAGDPSAFNDRMAITVEDQVAVSGITRSARRYLEGRIDVLVTDGKLTIGNASWAVANKIAYLAVERLADLPTIAIEAASATADENGSTEGRFTITRSGDLSQPVTINLTLTGSATNGTDYGVIGDVLLFDVGVATINLPVAAREDTLTEGTESLTLTLGPVAGYRLAQSAATVTITDRPPAPPVVVDPTAGKTLSWKTTTSLPQAKAEAFSAAVAGKVYAFGGYFDSTFLATDSAYVFNPANSQWSSIRTLPLKVAQAATASDDRYVYFAGGYVTTGTSQTFATKKAYRYDTTTDTYAALPDLPIARGPGAMAVLGRSLYFLGGGDSQRKDVATVYALDLDNTGAGWTTRASMPAARNRFGAAVVNGSIYVIGGQTGNDAAAVYTTNVWRYDASSNAWTTLASMPTARSHTAASTLVLGNKIIVAGGEGAGRKALSKVERYDPTTNTWSTLTSLPGARFSGISGVINNKIYFAGGYNGAFYKTTWVGTFV